MYTNTMGDMAYQEMVNHQNHNHPNIPVGLVNHKLSNNITISPALAVSGASPNQYQIQPKQSTNLSPGSYQNSHSNHHSNQNHHQNLNHFQSQIHASQSLPPNKNLSHVPCKFFRQGACQAGDSCPFSHSLNDFESLSKQPCKYYIKGKCKFGMKCALGHYLPDGRRVNNYTSKQTPRYHSHDNSNQSSIEVANTNNTFNHNLAIQTQNQTPRYSSAPSYITNTPSSSVATSSSSTNSTTFSSNSNLNRTPLAVYTKNSCATTPNSAIQQHGPSPTSLLSSPLQYNSPSVFPSSSVFSASVAYNNSSSKLNNPYFDGSAIFDEDETEDYASSCGSTSNYSGDNVYSGSSSDFASPKLNQTINNNYNTLIQNNTAMKLGSGSRRISTSSSNSGSIGFLNSTHFNNKMVTAKPDSQIIVNKSNSKNDMGNKFPILRSMSSPTQNHEVLNNLNSAAANSNNITILNSPIYSKKSGSNVTFLQPFNSSLNNANVSLANGSAVAASGGDNNPGYHAGKSSSFQGCGVGFTEGNWSGSTTDARLSSEENCNKTNFGSAGYDTMFYMESPSLKYPLKAGEAKTMRDYNVDGNENVDFTDDLKKENNHYFDLVPSMLGNLLISQEPER